MTAFAVLAVFGVAGLVGGAVVRWREYLAGYFATGGGPVDPYMDYPADPDYAYSDAADAGGSAGD